MLKCFSHFETQQDELMKTGDYNSFTSSRVHL